ncbi:hypothetical protein K431DRAFT_205168, partial [Polychaeton citri CBS 116435]
ILPLSDQDIVQIRSSKQVTSLQGVALALVENSIDAGADRISIEIDFRRGSCTVEDNGHGIAAAEFAENGGLCKPYHTSKHEVGTAAAIHSRTGTFLASLGALSLLCIISRHASEVGDSRLTIHQGRVLGRGAGQHRLDLTIASTSSGTRVQVRDLFGNLPVRVKQRALHVNTHTDNERPLQELKYGLVALLMFWQQRCAITVDNEYETRLGRKTLRLSTLHSALHAPLIERHIRHLNRRLTTLNLKDFLPVLAQAGFCPAEHLSDWISASADVGDVSVKGIICMQPAATKSCQFLSFGVNPCYHLGGGGELFNAINTIFGNSSFGVLERESKLNDSRSDHGAHEKRSKPSGYTRRQLKGKKGVDRWPMFVLRIQIAESQRFKGSIEHATDGQLKAVTDILQAVCTQWLLANNFRLNGRRSTRKTYADEEGSSSEPILASSRDTSPSKRLNSQSPTKRILPAPDGIQKRRKVLDENGHLRSVVNDSLGPTGPAGIDKQLCSHIRSGKQGFHNHLWETTPIKFSADPISSGSKASTVTGAKMSDVYGSIGGNATLATTAGETANISNTRYFPSEPNNHEEASQSVDKIIDWVDPVSKEIHSINARTGIAIPLRQKTTSRQADSSQSRPNSVASVFRTSSMIDSRSCVSLEHRAISRGFSDQAYGQRLPDFLKDWDNPVFGRRIEQDIPRLSTAVSGGGPASHICHANEHVDCGLAASMGTYKLSKPALLAAQVINQVDQKFILCGMSVSEATTHKDRKVLVLIDQHAASERIILEGLLSELCTTMPRESSLARFQSNLGLRSGILAILLDHGIRYHVTSSERRHFVQYGSHFARWGILYDVFGKESERSNSQVRQLSEDQYIVVRTLPSGISERCRLVPDLLIDLLRTELWRLVDRTSRPSTTDEDVHDASRKDMNKIEQSQHAWLSGIGSCPKGIIDILNSRACRSAIMFNDALTVAQCEDMVARLGGCAFPFMCAHGRTSMVPLAGLKG